MSRRLRCARGGIDEGTFLRELHEIVEGGPTPAEDLLEAYHGPWGENIDALFADIAY